MPPLMGAVETIRGLAAFERRAGGSDAERRAANWLRDELGAARDRETRIETFWCRPNTALAHAWHVGLGVAGSLLAVASPRAAGIIILVALVSLIADAMLGVSLGRRLTPERASQNVVRPAREPAPPPTGAGAARPDPAGAGAAGAGAAGIGVRLIITANYDAGRGGVIYRDAPRRAAARLRHATGNLAPGWLGWAVIALLWLELVTLARVGGASGTGVGLIQLPPTAGLVLALAALLDVGSADVVPAANDNGSGTAIAIALARALDAAPPRHAAIELVLQGASDGTAAGLRHHLRANRASLQRVNTVVVGVGPSGAGHVAWFDSDGPLVPLRAFTRLRALARTLARDDPDMGLRPHHHRGTSPSLAARIRRIPSITIGAIGDAGLIPHSHQASDTADRIDERTLGLVLESGLLLIDAIDSSLASRDAAAAPRNRPS